MNGPVCSSHFSCPEPSTPILWRLLDGTLNALSGSREKAGRPQSRRHHGATPGQTSAVHIAVASKVVPMWQRMTLPSAFGCRDLDSWARKFRQNVRANASATVVAVSQLLAAETFANCQAVKHQKTASATSATPAVTLPAVSQQECCRRLRPGAGDNMTLL